MNVFMVGWYYSELGLDARPMVYDDATPKSFYYDLLTYSDFSELVEPGQFFNYNFKKGVLEYNISYNLKRHTSEGILVDGSADLLHINPSTGIPERGYDGSPLHYRDRFLIDYNNGLPLTEKFTSGIWARYFLHPLTPDVQQNNFGDSEKRSFFTRDGGAAMVEISKISNRLGKEAYSCRITTLNGGYSTENIVIGEDVPLLMEIKGDSRSGVESYLLDFDEEEDNYNNITIGNITIRFT